jgi:hypothetical protein
VLGGEVARTAGSVGGGVAAVDGGLGKAGDVEEASAGAGDGGAEIAGNRGGALSAAPDVVAGWGCVAAEFLRTLGRTTTAAAITAKSTAAASAHASGCLFRCCARAPTKAPFGEGDIWSASYDNVTVLLNLLAECLPCLDGRLDYS